MKYLLDPKPLVIFVLIGAITGCYSFIGRYGDPFYEGSERQYFEKLIDESLPHPGQESDFDYVMSKDSDLTVIGAEPDFLRTCSNSPLILRFAWLSDVQLRQQEVKLFSDKVSLNLDTVIPSFEHNPVQEDFDWAVYLSMIAAINHYHREDKNDPKIDFMIHTGDAIDAGTIEELYDFTYITNKILVPWLNVVGNHDVAIFGNYKERLGYTRKAAVNFYPVGNQLNFVTMHGKKRFISGFGTHLLPVASQGGHTPSEDGEGKVPRTNYHGFDLQQGKGSSASIATGFTPDQAPGYYAFDFKASSVPVRFIALNSAKMEKWGADGVINKAQRKWLRQMIRTGDKRLLLIFAHHRPTDFDKETMAVLNDSQRGPMVFFSGHTHKHHIKSYTAENGQQFYELNTGSILEYPQIGRVIEIHGDSEEDMCLISRGLWNNYMNSDGNISSEELQDTLKLCVDKRMDSRKALKAAVKCGNYGAYKDYLDNKNKPWGSPQNMQDALKAANVVIPLGSR